MATRTPSPRSRWIALAAIGTALSISLAAVLGWAPADGAAGAPRAPEAPVDERCARASKPFAVGTTSVNVASRGRRLNTTVAYPAAGGGSRAACGKFPLIVVGHGAQGTGSSAAALHAYLVRSGYIVAAPTFPSGFDLDGYARDVSRVISRVRGLNRRGGVPFARRVRASRVGYIGTSMGAMTGFSLYRRCCDDRRIDAVVAKLGSSFGSGYKWGAGPPLLMINGTADDVVPYAEALRTYRRAKRPKGLITLRGIGHDLLTGNDPILTESTLGFFARYLRGNRSGLRRVERAADRSPIAALRKRW